MHTISPSRKFQGRGRKRPDIAITLPAVVFTTLRSIGIRDRALADATGIPRPMLTRVCSGNADRLDLSAEEFSKLQAFAAEKLAMAEAAAAALADRGGCFPWY